MTINEITKTVTKAKGAIRRRQIYRYIAALDIKPLGCRQRPQIYPPDTANRILAHLGLTVIVEPLVRTTRQKHTSKSQSARAALLSLKQIKQLTKSK